MSVKQALAVLWKDSCTITVRKPVDDEAITRFVEEDMVTGQPCKLSFESLSAVGDGNVASTAQLVKLFLDKNVKIPAGCKITVLRDGETFVFARSGEPGVFTYHQEVPLELWKRWA